MIGAVVVISIIVTVVIVQWHARVRTGPRSRPVALGTSTDRPPGVEQPETPAPLAVPRAVPGELQRWVGEGLISPDQAAAIVVFEQGNRPAIPQPITAPSPRDRPRIPAVAEALGYLGGVMAVVGVALVVHRAWGDLGAGGRLAVSAAVALALAGAGLAVDEHRSPVMARLRAVLWLASSAAVALFMVVGTVDVLDSTARATEVAAAAAGVALEACAFRWWATRPLQQASFILAVLVGAGAIAAELASAGPVGLTVWVVGAAFAGLGVLHRGPLPLLTFGMGAMASLVGAGIVTSDWNAAGLPLSVVTGAGLLALAVVYKSPAPNGGRVVAGAIGGLGLAEAVPSTIGFFADQAAAATGVVVWAVGVALLEIGDRRLVRGGVAVELAGVAAVFGGAALTWSQWHGIAPLFGIGSALTLMIAGVLAGRALLSLVGAGGLAVDVPWAIAWFFPGEGRIPVIVLVVGLILIAIAVFVGRDRGRYELRRDVSRHRRLAGPRPIPHGH